MHSFILYLVEIHKNLEEQLGRRRNQIKTKKRWIIYVTHFSTSSALLSFLFIPSFASLASKVGKKAVLHYGLQPSQKTVT